MLTFCEDKKPTFADDLAKALPSPDGFANVYFDNVAGDVLDLMLGRMAKYGRIACCGAISGYNTADKSGIKNWFEIVIMRLQAKGFIVLDFADKFGEAQKIFREALSEGKLQIDEGEHIVSGSFEDVPKTWLKLFGGENTGKLVTAIQ